MNKKMIVGLVCGAALLAAGCDETGKDAGVSERVSGDRPVYNMPDNFPNLSAVCVKGHLVIETTGDGRVGMQVVQNDPTCVGLDGVPPRPVSR
jgi:hypothetical protein